MCVLIYKPKGLRMPDKSVLKACFEANPHGAGFATTKGVHHSMNFQGVYRMLCQIPKEEPCIIHFRLATTGSICLRNCHPFKNGNVYFAHNGVLSIPTKDDMTDSETAFKWLYPTILKYGLDSKELDNKVKQIIGYSKFAFLCGEKIKLYGEFRQINGIYYSNLRWRNYMNI